MDELFKINGIRGKTKEQIIDLWNDTKADRRKRHVNFDGEAAIFNLCINILEIVQEIQDNQKEEIIEIVQAQNTCSLCGLKRMYWDKMFCGAGKDHEE